MKFPTEPEIQANLCLPHRISRYAELIHSFHLTWVATDAIGRTMPSSEEAGPPK